MNAASLLSKYKSINFPQIAGEVLSRHAAIIAELNRQQLSQGKTAEDTATTLNGRGYYSPLTVFLKMQRSGLASVVDRITGFGSGEMYRGIYFEVRGERTVYGSRSDSADKFVAKTGNRIFGLTDKNRQDLINESIRPETIRELKEKLK